MREILLLGRVFFSLIFILSGFNHFNDATITAAAAQGVPYAGLLVPLSGLLAIFGGLSVFFGYRAKVGGWMLAAFLVPVTLKMHAFWLVGDAAEARLQQIFFLKNLSMLGGAFAFAYFGSGPYSVDRRMSVDDRTKIGMNTGIAGTVIPTALRREDELAKASEGALKANESSRIIGTW